MRNRFQIQGSTVDLSDAVLDAFGDGHLVVPMAALLVREVRVARDGRMHGESSLAEVPSLIRQRS